MLKGDEVPENRHFMNLDAREVSTGSFELIRYNVAEGIELGEICLISGPAGVGKTFAVRSALHSLGPNGGIDPSTQLRELRLRSSPSPKIIAERLSRAVMGEHLRLPTERDYTDRLLEALEMPTVIFVDEAQFLTSVGMHYLRFLFDEQATRLSLVLAGGPGVYRHISSDDMLRSRIGSHVPLERLTPDEVIEYIPGLHPMLESAPSDLIQVLDSEFAHGNFRAWVKVVKKASKSAEIEGKTTLTPELAEQVLDRIGDLEEDEG